MAADPKDLCTLAQVRLALQKQAGQTATDERIQDCITRASDAVMEFTGREFRTVFGTLSGGSYDGVGTRNFHYAGGGALHFDHRCDLRTLTSVTITDGNTGSTVTTLTADEYRFLTLNPRGGVHTAVQLRGYSPPPGDSSTDYESLYKVAVTGTWGFATVPDDVREATLMTACHWVRQLAFWGSSFDPDQQIVDGRWAIPGMAQSMLKVWKRQVA